MAIAYIEDRRRKSENDGRTQRGKWGNIGGNGSPHVLYPLKSTPVEKELDMTENLTATQIMEETRMDLRKRRAESLARSIMHVVGKFIARENDREFYYSLVDLLANNGADVITDDTRAEAGLPPRDGKGWTSQELQALEMKRLELMSRPLMDPFMQNEKLPT